MREELSSTAQFWCTKDVHVWNHMTWEEAEGYFCFCGKFVRTQGKAVPIAESRTTTTFDRLGNIEDELYAVRQLVEQLCVVHKIPTSYLLERKTDAH